MKYYLFNFTSKSGESITVIFDHWHELSEQLVDELREYHTYREQCYKTIYICPAVKDRNVDVEQMTIAEYSNKPKDLIQVITYNETGLRDYEDQVLINEIAKFGLLDIVKKRNAILESDDSFHYVLPSGKHSSFFIRTGNILANSEEINFIALMVMTKGKIQKLSCISCDSSSILQIPYAINYLLGLFGKRLEIPYNSFGSYNNPEEFHFKPGSLVLISASNSGDLEDKISGYEKDLQFLTILFNNTKNKYIKHIINLNPYLNDIVNVNTKDIYRHGIGCKYCDTNSIPVVVRGEQFIPSRALIQRVLLTKWHVPSWISKYGKMLFQNDAIQIYKRDNSSLKKREIFIDVERLLSDDSKFNEEFDKYLKNYIPASLDQIVYIKEHSSERVAQKVYKYFTEVVKKPIPIPVPHTLISSLNKKLPQTILVISSCVTTGNKLNSISREIRDFDLASVHYFSAIARLTDSNKLEVLGKNLEYKSSDKTTCVYKFHKVISCFLGDFHDQMYTEYAKPPWEIELNFWKSLSEQIDLSSMNERIRKLEGESGLSSNELFFQKPYKPNIDLSLRKNFAFYNFAKNYKPSQAEVYFIVSAVFHYLRNPKFIEVDKRFDTDKFMVQHEHVKTILDPECFKRYNDGLIQACLLRCARKSELNYSVSESDSMSMLSTLKDIFKLPNAEDSNEAINEFLYAIAIKKLKLQKLHHDNFIEFVKLHYLDNLIVKLFIDIIGKTSPEVHEAVV